MREEIPPHDYRFPGVGGGILGTEITRFGTTPPETWGEPDREGDPASTTHDDRHSGAILGFFLRVDRKFSEKIYSMSTQKSLNNAFVYMRSGATKSETAGSRS